MPGRGGIAARLRRGPHRAGAGTRPGAARRLAIAVGIGAVFLANVDASAFTLAVPLLHRAFPAAPAGQLSLVQSGYGIGFAALILLAGQFTDRRGPRWPLVAGLTLFTAASLAGAAAPGPLWVYAARTASGAGIATAVPAALSLLLADADGTARRRRTGQWGAAGAMAAGCGPVLGGVLGQLVGWRGLFLLTAAPAAVMLAVAVLGPAAREPAARPARARGTVLRRPGVPLAVLASAIVGAGVYALQVMTGFALVGGAGLSAVEAGLVLSPASLLAAFTALRVGHLRDSRGTGIACAAGGALLLAGTATAVLAGRAAPLAGAAAGATLGVVGLGVAATCVSTAAVLAAGPAVGRVTSISQVARQAGGAAGAATAGAAIGSVLSPGALDSGWAMLAVTGCLIVILGGALARSPARMPS